MQRCTYNSIYCLDAPHFLVEFSRLYVRFDRRADRFDTPFVCRGKYCGYSSRIETQTLNKLLRIC